MLRRWCIKRLEILADQPSSTSGTYYIDFDGTATATTCDMSTDGGGWTLIFTDDFDDGGHGTRHVVLKTALLGPNMRIGGAALPRVARWLPHVASAASSCGGPCSFWFTRVCATTRTASRRTASA